MKLVSSKTIEKQICYDLSVNKNHNYFANGICVHNTNGGVNILDDNISIQSRERILSIESDNAGFYTFIMKRKNQLIRLRDCIFANQNYDIKTDTLRIYGEYVGVGIQKNVGIANLEKSWFIFEIGIESGGEYKSISIPTEL